MYNPYCGKKIRVGLDLFPKKFTDGELSDHYYRLIADNEHERLMFESASFDEIDTAYNPGELVEMDIYEAIIVKQYSKTQTKMEALQRVFNKYLANNGITAQAPVVGKPKKTGQFASVTVQIPLSDGQAVSIIFHSPEGDKKQITASDEIIAYRWLLNKRDITHVVSPEDGQDVSLETLGQRVSQLVAKNTAKFQAQQKTVADQKAKVAELQATVQTAETSNQDLMNQLREVQDDRDVLDLRILNAKKLLDSVKAYNQKLQDQIDQWKAQQEANKGKPGGEGTVTPSETKATFADPLNTSLLPMLKGRSKDKTAQKELLKATYPDYDPKHHDVFVQRYNADLETAKQVAYQENRGIEDTNKVTPTPEPETPSKPLAEMNKEELLAAIAAGLAPERSGNKADEARAYQLLGMQAVPGLRFNDAYDVGKVYEHFSKGGMTQEDWDAYAAELYRAGNATKPESVQPEPTPEPEIVEPTPEPTPEPAAPTAVTTLNDILAGKYDGDTTQVGNLLDQAAEELDAAGLMDQYDGLLNQAADYLTELLRKKAALYVNL